MNFYKLHIGDYESHTAHLTWMEEAAYSRLLRIYYRTEKPLPVDRKEIYRLARTVNGGYIKEVDRVLAEFFILCTDGYHNKRCDEEIVKYQKQCSTNRRIAGERTVQRSVHAPTTKRTPNQIPEPELILKALQEVSTGAVDNSEPKAVEVKPEPVKTDTAKPQRSESFSVQCLSVATRLHKRGVAVTAQHTVLQKWVSEGFTYEQLNEAVELARQRKPEPETISAGYLDSIVRRAEKATA